MSIGPVILVVGARPNFMKIAPIHAELARRGVSQLLLHTGQHYDEAMSKIFFEELGMPRPDVYLGVGSGTHAEQTGRVMIDFEKVCFEHKPAYIVVVGDVNSTLACALVAAKLGIPVAHVEAGLRSRDWAMPEEVNRVLTDRIADHLLTPSRDGDANLLAEGISPEKITFVGNIMIDTLLTHLEDARASGVHERVGVERGKYAVLTLHRPSNVDDRPTFERILGALERVGQRIPLVFPVHPRTRNRAEEFGLLERLESIPNIVLCPPLGYLEFQGLTSGAALVMTDSGGLQEETTALGIACITLRENTERPITVTEGTNVIVGSDPERIVEEANRVLDGEKDGEHRIPECWDGQTASRIADVIEGALGRGD
jgi:UDP-N-acetylglucosamine 2-epimerase (non-hydrolysing)